MGLLDKVSKEGQKGFASLKSSMSGGSDKLDMYRPGDMQYAVKDSTFRDIYERGNEQQGSPKLFATVVPLMAVILFLFITVILVPAVVAGAQQSNWFFTMAGMYLIPGRPWLVSFLMAAVSFGIYQGVKVFAVKYWESQHSDSSAELLNQFKDDSRIQQPEELAENFDIFPDVGAHSHETDVTAVLGHYVFNNDGVNKVRIPLRADGKGTYDDPDDPLNKNVVLYDDNDNIAMVTKPLIDEAFGEVLWTSAGIPKVQGKNAGYIRHILRHRYSPDKLRYNPTHKFGKPDFAKVSDWINHDWYMPDYEVQRPAGAYVVDTEPNNTMVLAMTRAGKGNELSLIA